MVIACGSAWRVAPRLTHELAAPWVCGHTGGCTHVGAAADGPDFGPSRTGRGRLAAAAHGLRERRRAMARRRGQLAAPWVCGHTGGCTHVGAGGRRARFWTIWEPPPSLRSHDPFRLKNICCSRVPTAPAVGTLAHLFSFLAPFLLRWAAPALACNLEAARFLPPTKRAAERFATDPATATTGATDGATVPLCVFIFGCALLLGLRDRSVVTRTQCMHTGIGPVLPGGRAMHELRGSMVLQQG